MTSSLYDDCVRLVIENPRSAGDNVLVVAVWKNGNIIVSVSDEKAVDSYNAVFECSISLRPDEARKVSRFILDSLEKNLSPVSGQADEAPG